MAYPAVGDAGTDTVAPPNDWASKLLATLAVHSDTSGNLVASTAISKTPPCSASADTRRFRTDIGFLRGRSAPRR